MGLSYYVLLTCREREGVLVGIFFLILLYDILLVIYFLYILYFLYISLFSAFC